MGKSSLMVASDSATMAELNRRARANLIATGAVVAEGLDIAGGATAGVGDEVVTRENNRLLATGRRWVKNGDRWTVTATNKDGSMTVKRAGGGEVVLPADYVAENVELAYACTAHRVQGQTVDTAHAMISPTTSREVLYVAATRGRISNRLYVDTHYDPDPQTSHDGVVRVQAARAVLAGVLRREGADVGAHDTIRASREAAEGMVQLHAEYTTLAKAALAERWDGLLERSGLSAVRLADVRESEAYGPLVAAFRDAESRGLDIEATLPRLVAARSLADAHDVASLLHARVDRWVEAAGSKTLAAAELIVGLVPRATEVADADMARALLERDEAMERRATTLAEQAVERNVTWVRRLGVPPVDPAMRAAWIREVRVVAAYRDRWGTGGQAVVDRREDVRTIEQLGHRRRAQAAAARAMAITRQGHDRQDNTGADVPSQSVETTGVVL